jgi:hypothetical protein
MRKALLTAGEIRFRASPLDVRRLARLAHHYETSVSGILRRLISEAWDRVKPTRRAAPRKRK